MSRVLSLLGCLLLLSSSLYGEIRLPKIFGNHAVLQRDKKVAIWGWGEPGERVTVSFVGQIKSSRVEQDGSWKVELDEMQAQAVGSDLTVQGSESDLVTLKNILVGEVWMASGQSNMAWRLSRTEGATEEIAIAKFPAIRMYITKLRTAAEPKEDLEGSWFETTPENAGEFSAVGYYFAKRLQGELDVPVGIIRTAWGGKPSQAFTTLEKLSTKPEGKELVDYLANQMAAYDAEEEQKKFEARLAEWEEKVATIKAENAAMVEMAKEDPSLEVTKKKAPRKPSPPIVPNLNSKSPAAIYNAMIHPWVGYGMRGTIWYQGESNRNRAKQYETIFPLLIEDWRERWGEEFPFYFVQLANFQEPSKEPGVANPWAELQNAQRLTLSLPKTGMAVINDIGDAKDIHPQNKKDVGERLARWALAKDYGRADLVFSGPLYSGSVIEGNQIRVVFDHADGLKSRDGESLERFEIAGADQKWYWAEAVIEGKSVVVSSEEVPEPVAVRYAWAANPEGANLVNGEDLPASLFRTDDWKLSTEK